MFSFFFRRRTEITSEVYVRPSDKSVLCIIANNRIEKHYVLPLLVKTPLPKPTGQEDEKTKIQEDGRRRDGGRGGQTFNKQTHSRQTALQKTERDQPT